MHGKWDKRQKRCALLVKKRREPMSYKKKDRQKESLFKELMPFGGKLEMGNRWIKLEELIPWEELEEIYEKYFSRLGRPGKSSQLVNGLLIVKHKMVMSDEETVEYFHENPYVQYFCGYDQFVMGKEIESSTLTRMRKRLGVEYFKKFEEEIIRIVKDRKIIKKREQMVDATVYPSDITYPTDTGLIERVREWIVGNIKKVRKLGGLKEKIRTHCRKAKKTYLKFTKKRKRTKREIRKAKKQLLQYVRRNIEQLKGVLRKARKVSIEVRRKIKERLKVAEKIYEQQMYMLKEKINRVEKRIVSFHRSHIRPIVRGKSGKDVEFGPKCSMSYVDGYLFLDKLSYEAYHEGKVLKEDIQRHKERFGARAKVIITDRIYGTRENREMLEREGTKGSLIPLGRKNKHTGKKLKWIREKQRRRSEIEGAIGNSKVNYGLERITYRNEELQIRLGLIAMNLSTAMARI